MTARSQLNDQQLAVLDVVTRVFACLSMVCAAFTVTSYLSCQALRKPFNRLALFIAASNICGGLAYSWGTHPLFAGRTTAFCQTQAFLIQWVVMADPLLVFVMAASVWFRICTRQNSAEVHFLENIGIGCALGLPFVPALVFLCWRPNGLTVYGSAGLWCWISAESNGLRISSFYAPIWVTLLLSIILFSLSGSRIIHTRAQVRRAQSICQTVERPRKLSMASFGSYAWQSRKRKSFSSWKQPSINEFSSNSNGTADEFATTLPAPARAYSTPEILVAPVHIDSMNSSLSPNLVRSTSDPASVSRRSSRFEAMHWKYARFAFLCCFVLLVTWVPISIMRIYNNFINPQHPIIALYYASAVCIPLQGVGNFIVYITGSWPECRTWVMSLVSKLGFKKHPENLEGDVSAGL